MLEVKNLVKVYSTKGGVTVRALDDVSVKFPETGMVFLLGRSGSGKSTLLNVAGGLDRPDSGEVIVKGRSSKNFSAADFDSYRNTCVGFVFQEYNILNEFSIEQNISLALQLQNKKNDKAAVNALLEQVDLKGLGKRKPNTLSGGQKQRVAIARALIKEPEIIMADEPTGALDSNTGKQVFDTLKKLSETKLVIVVSHDRDFAEYYADRIIELKDGNIIEDVSKTYSAPKQLSDNVQMVSDDTVTIKNAEKITEAEVKNIVAMLKKNGGEAVITAGKRDIKDVKRACKINDDGSKESFKETGDVETLEYDGKKTKFIKSRLPASHAFKIGASGLKTKPVRLIFTILLSVVAFVMFGVVSTFMLYDESYSIASALQESNYPATKIINSYSVNNQYIRVDLDENKEEVDWSGESSMSTMFSKSDIDKLNENSLGLKFAGVFSLTDRWSSANLPMYASATSGLASNDYFPVTDFGGFTDCGEAFMSANGFTLIDGKYPAANDEIAVMNYVDALYKTKTDTALNKKITFSINGEEKEFKIVGVYNVGEIPQKYETLKTALDNSASKSEQEERRNLLSSYKDMLDSGFYTLAFVSDGFYDAYVNENNANNIGNNYLSTAYMSGVLIENNSSITNVDETNGTNVYTDRIVKYNKNSFKFYDLDGNELTNIDKENLGLGEKDVYVVKYDDTNEYVNALRDLISSASRNFYDAASNLRSSVKAGKEEYSWNTPFSNKVEEYNNYLNSYYFDSYAREQIETLYSIKAVLDDYANIVENPTEFAANYLGDKIKTQYILGSNESKELASYCLDDKMYYGSSYSDEEKAKIKAAVNSEDYEYFMGKPFNIGVDYDKRYFKNYLNMEGEFNVKGYFEMVGVDYYDNSAVVLSDTFFLKYARYHEYGINTSTTKYNMPSDLKYVSAVTLTDNSQDQIAFMLAGEPENDIVRDIDNNVYNGLQMFVGMINSMQLVFLIIGGVVGVFAALMLLNFISTSISAKRKEIGILRAVGARGSDVFKIFFAEAFIIAMICFVLSVVGAGVACGIINKSVTGLELIPTAKLLDFGLINVGLILAISLFVSAIATFFPVLSASKKPPVESIRAL